MMKSVIVIALLALAACASDKPVFGNYTGNNTLECVPKPGEQACK